MINGSWWLLDHLPSTKLKAPLWVETESQVDTNPFKKDTPSVHLDAKNARNSKTDFDNSHSEPK